MYYTCDRRLQVNGCSKVVEGGGECFFLQVSHYDPMVFIEAICMLSADWRIVPGDWTSRGQFKNPGSLFCETRPGCRREWNYHHAVVLSLPALCGNSGSSPVRYARCHGIFHENSASHVEMIQFKWSRMGQRRPRVLWVRNKRKSFARNNQRKSNFNTREMRLHVCPEWGT